MQKKIAAMAAAAASSIALLAAVPAAASASPRATCHWLTTAYPVLYVRSGPGTGYPVKGSIPYHTSVSGNCTPANGNWYFILDPFDNTYHWANGQYLQPN